MSYSSHPFLALQKALLARLAGDAALSALLGGPRIHAEPPRAAEPPYVGLSESRTNDWSTVSDRGHEHLFTLSVWSRQPGIREALAVAGRIEELLEDADLALEGHRLVNLRLLSQEFRREGRDGTRRVALRLRAVTEEAS